VTHARRKLTNAELLARHGDLTLATAIRAHIEQVMELASGPRQAAELLGIGRTTLYRWRKGWRGARAVDDVAAPAAREMLE
jgi:hypothetical protein